MAVTNKLQIQKLVGFLVSFAKVDLDLFRPWEMLIYEWPRGTQTEKLRRWPLKS